MYGNELHFYNLHQSENCIFKKILFNITSKKCEVSENKYENV